MESMCAYCTELYSCGRRPALAGASFWSTGSNQVPNNITTEHGRRYMPQHALKIHSSSQWLEALQEEWQRKWKTTKKKTS